LRGRPRIFFEIKLILPDRPFDALLMGMKRAKQQRTQAAAGAHVPAAWAQQELGSAVLPDARLVERLLLVASQWAEQPNAAIPEACGSPAATKAAYRFLEQTEVRPQAIWGAHCQASLERMKAHRLILVPQDTTGLSYGHLGTKADLGPMGSDPQAQGLWLHHAQALTPKGEPLGLVYVKLWARDAAQRGQAQRRYQRPLEDKESFKWLEGFRATELAARQLPQSRLISIGDSEEDVYPVMLAARQSDCPNVGLLVRLAQNRKVEGPEGKLFDHLHGQPVARRFDVQVPRHQQQPARLASLEIRFCPLEIQPPKRQPTLPTLSAYGIEAYEPAPPAGLKAVHWRLLSTRPIASVQAALRQVAWYGQRWSLEVYHRVLKSGCRVEARQLESAEAIRRMVAIYMVIAWRIVALTQAARQPPPLSAGVWLEEAEWQTLACWAQQTALPPKTAPTVGQAVLWIAQLGGFLARKGDGEPGPTHLWRGLQRLQDMTLGFLLNTCEKSNER
jgi:hypothetical protein